MGSTEGGCNVSPVLVSSLLRWLPVNRWGQSMQQIAEWLEKLGMSEYAELFVANRIDLSVLPELTDQDLKELGIVLGDRRKILRAIAGHKSSETIAPNPKSQAVNVARPQDAAERRQVTVMFSDLVGSTALSARMDPEDLREVISAYQKCVAATVQRYGGFIAKYMGDGVLVYFGYPQAHEDDAERAVRAGSASQLASWSLATSSALALLRSKQSSGRRRTLQRACRALRSRTAWSWRRGLGSSWVTSSSFRTWEHRTSRVFQGGCKPGGRCGLLQSRAASTLSTRAR